MLGYIRPPSCCANQTRSDGLRISSSPYSFNVDRLRHPSICPTFCHSDQHSDLFIESLFIEPQYWVFHEEDFRKAKDACVVKPQISMVLNDSGSPCRAFEVAAIRGSVCNRVQV